MCGIAGLIHRGKQADIGGELLSMLQALKHRGPDSTGLAVYGSSSGIDESEYVMRYKVAEGAELATGFRIFDQIKERRAAVQARLAESAATILSEEEATEYAFRCRFNFEGDMRRLANYLEDIEGVEILSIGNWPDASYLPQN